MFSTVQLWRGIEIICARSVGIEEICTNYGTGAKIRAFREPLQVAIQNGFAVDDVSYHRAGARTESKNRFSVVAI